MNLGAWPQILWNTPGWPSEAAGTATVAVSVKELKRVSFSWKVRTWAPWQQASALLKCPLATCCVSVRVPVYSWPCASTFRGGGCLQRQILWLRAFVQCQKKKRESKLWVIIFQHFSGQRFFLMRDFFQQRPHLWRLSLDAVMISQKDLNLQS